MRLDYKILFISLTLTSVAGSFPDLQAMQSMVSTLGNGQI